MINIPVTVKIALRALKANKMRSALTTLGIVIGVAAVIAMLALGSGARQKVSEEIASMGSNLLVVISGSVSSGGARMGSGTDPTLSLLDAEAVERECPAVLDVAPVDSGTAQIVYGNQNWSTVITGTTPSILHINAWDIASGRPFTMQDVRHATKVCLMGKTVTDNLFLGTDPVGKIVRIKKVPFKVIGVLGSKGQTMLGQDHDDVIYVPITTGQKKLFGTTIAGMIRVMMVKAKSVNKLEEAETQINELLKQRHRIRPNQDNDFTVKNLTQMTFLNFD